MVGSEKVMTLLNYFEVISAGVVSGLLIRRLIRLLNRARKQRAAMYRHVNKEN
jgi:hypothetical protein